MKNTLFGIFVAGWSTLGSGKDIYVAQDSAGVTSGANCANAYSAVWFNAPTNWGAAPNQINPGDTVHLCGVITQPLIVQGSGSAGHTTIILFEPGAKLSSPAWPPSGAIAVGSNAYVTIDGGANGVVENTGNGTALPSQTNSVGILASGASNFTVRNVTVQNIYVRTGTTDQGGQAAWGIVNRAPQSNIVNFIVTHCTIHDVAVGVIAEYSAGNANFEVSSNVIYNVNHGVDCPDRNSSSSVTNISIHHNKIYAFTNWNDTASNSFHHNAIYAWAEQGGASILNDLTIYANTLGPGLGGPYQTSLIYHSGHIAHSRIYNNLLVCNPGEYAGMGLLVPQATISEVSEVYNNTFIGGGTGSCLTLEASQTLPQVLSFTNNVSVGNAGGTSLAIYYVTTKFTLNADRNLAYNFGSSTFCYSTNGSFSGVTFAQWQGLGFDRNGSIANPNLSSNYVPVVAISTNVIGKGANLYGFFTTDKVGVQRPFTGPWDLGAYCAPVRPAAPTSLRALGP